MADRAPISSLPAPPIPHGQRLAAERRTGDFALSSLHTFPA